MDNTQLLKRLLLLKNNPKLAEVLPQGEILKYMESILVAFQALKKTIDTSKNQENEDVYSKEQIEAILADSISKYELEVSDLLKRVETKIETLKDSINVENGLDGVDGKNGTDGKDGQDGKSADITEDIKYEIAEMCRTLIELPDFDALVSDKITSNPEAVRDSLELLFEENRYKVRISDIEGLKDILNQLAAIRNGGLVGGLSKNAVLDLIEQFGGGSGVPNGGTTGQVLTKLSNTDGDANWATPPGSGDMVLASAQTNSGLKTFLNGTFGLRNVANTFTSLFTNAATAARTYTLKDASGTIAFVSDITGTNSGTNTGDQTSIVGITGTRAQFDTAVTDGNFMYIGDAPTAHTHLLAAGATDVTMTATNLNILDDGLNTTLHFHDADRARANHTGSQLASTISDFAATVRSTVLTGLSLVSVTVISATDTVLVALGSLQAQITALTTTVTGKVDTSRTISTTAPLSGGGDLSANRTLTTSMATNKLIGRGTAGTGVMEEITLGTGLSFSGTTLNASGSGGTITTQDEGVPLSTTVTTLNFTGAGVTASGAGATTTINIPGGSGSSVSGQATVNFGAVTTENSITRVTVNTASALTASIIMVSPSGKPTADHDSDDYQWDNITGYVSNIVNGVSFDIVGVAPNGSFGDYVFNYVIQ